MMVLKGRDRVVYQDFAEDTTMRLCARSTPYAYRRGKRTREWMYKRNRQILLRWESAGGGDSGEFGHYCCIVQPRIKETQYEEEAHG